MLRVSDSRSAQPRDDEKFYFSVAKKERKENLKTGCIAVPKCKHSFDLTHGLSTMQKLEAELVKLSAVTRLISFMRILELDVRKSGIKKAQR